MKMKVVSISVLAAGLMMTSLPSVQAQSAAGLDARLSVVEIKDATLKDALELIFKSAGVNNYLIDDAAAAVPIPDMVRQNISGVDLARQLVRNGDFILARNNDGYYTVRPRNPLPLGGENPGEFPGAGGFPGGFPRNNPRGSQGGVSNVPSNPFGSFGGRPGAPRTNARPLITPTVETRANSQTRPRVPGGGGAAGRTGGTGPEKFTSIIVRHVYVGGIASLFNNSSVIKTEKFVTPGGRNLGGGNQGGGFGGNQGGGFGIGGIGGGFGGGGFGGGGFGGGGFGGGGFGDGGFGGGGIGGGGFGNFR